MSGELTGLGWLAAQKPATSAVPTQPAGNGKSNGKSNNPPPGTGDYTTLDVVELARHHGAYGRDLGGGKHAVRCPNEDQHSTGKGAEDSDTVVFEGGNGQRPRFKCQHSHCGDLDLWAVIERHWTAADRYCAQAYPTARESNGQGWPVAPRANNGTAAKDPAPSGTTLEQILKATELRPDPETAYAFARDLARLSAADYATAKARLKEIVGRRLSVRDLDRAVKEVRGQRVTTRQGDGLPAIMVSNRPLREKAEEALAHLDQANGPPCLFVRSGRVARVEQDENGISAIENVTEAGLRSRLTRIADFYVETESGERHVSPPDDVVRDILARGHWPFPAIEGVTETPVLRVSGTILTEPGYDPETRLIYAPAKGMDLPEIPSNPTAADVDAAKRLIWEAVGEFPYTNQASAANVIAMMLTPVVRPAIPGNVPIGLIDAPQAGTGKGFLTDAITLIATGRTAAMMTAPDNDEEWRKKITSVLLGGSTVIVIDNVEQPLGSAHLASVLTAREWSDRRLGSSEQVRVPHRATWIATGNNIRLRGDMPRRAYWVRLDAKQARPWEREGFTHPNLPEWVNENRGRLLAALLIIARFWWANGCPPAPVKVLGNFEGWSRTIAGILEHAGIEGFLKNQGELYEQVDEETPEWESFLEAWATNLQFGAYTVSDLARRIQGVEAIRSALPTALSRAMDEPGASFERRLGKALSKRAGVSFSNGYRLEKAGTDSAKGHRQWRVTTDEERPESFPVSLFSLFDSDPVTCGAVENATFDTSLTETLYISDSPDPEAEGNGEHRETGKTLSAGQDLRLGGISNSTERVLGGTRRSRLRDWARDNDWMLWQVKGGLPIGGDEGAWSRWLQQATDAQVEMVWKGICG